VARSTPSTVEQHFYSVARATTNAAPADFEKTRGMKRGVVFVNNESWAAPGWRLSLGVKA
jgi:hypothetical protein